MGLNNREVPAVLGQKNKTTLVTLAQGIFNDYNACASNPSQNHNHHPCFFITLQDQSAPKPFEIILTLMTESILLIV